MGWPFGKLKPGAYRAIVADPPWLYKSYTALRSTNWHSRRDAEKHYDVMGLDDICALPVGQLAARDAHLFLWATGPCLPHALQVIEVWGFRYSAVAFTWVKLKKTHGGGLVDDGDFHAGLGLTTRKNAEFVLLGRRGNAKRLSRSVRELILTPRREHSRKPDELFDRVRRYCARPYVELFARERHHRFDSWGDESTKFNDRR